MNVISNEFNCLCCKLLHCLAQKIDFLITEHMCRKYGWNIFNISVWLYGPSNDSCTQHTIHPNIIPCNGNLWINMEYLFLWELMYLLSWIQGSMLDNGCGVHFSVMYTINKSSLASHTMSPNLYTIWNMRSDQQMAYIICDKLYVSLA
jgi:hypothetical protein